MSGIQQPQLSFGGLTDAANPGSNLSNLQFATGQVVGSGGVGASGASVSAPVSGVTDTSTVLNSPSGGGAQMGGSGNFWSKDGGAGLILGGVQVLGNLWNSYQAHKLAKEQMSFAREQWNTNLANQTQTYNTALEDRIRGRYADGVRSESEVQGEIDRHSL